jgi:hypothetical protein
MTTAQGSTGAGMDVVTQEIIVSQECDVFSRVQHLWDFASKKRTEHEPVVRNSNSNWVRWDLAPSMFYWTLPDIQLIMKVRVVTDKMDNIPASAICAFADAPVFTIFQSGELKINETVVESIQNNYHIRSYLMQRLQTTAESSKTWRGSLYGQFEDDPTMHTLVSDANNGFKRRKDMIAVSRVVQLRCVLPFGLCSSAKMIPPG